MTRRSSDARFSGAALLSLLGGGTKEPVEVDAVQGLDAGLVRQVEVQRRDGDRALADRLEVGALLLVEAGLPTVDLVAAATAFLAGQPELVAVYPLAEAAGPRAGGRAGRNVDVEQRALRDRHPLELLHEPRDERRGVLEVVVVARAVVELAA